MNEPTENNGSDDEDDDNALSQCSAYLANLDQKDVAKVFMKVPNFDIRFTLRLGFESLENFD